MTIVGARPQFIKASALSRVLAGRVGVQEILVHTGQHYDPNMSGLFFEELGIPEPGAHLGIGSGSHGEQTGRMLKAIEEAIARERPNWVVVYGDTNSTLAGALAAAKLYVPVAHVEAGLRSFNRRMPEEINRVLADHLSDLLLAPTVKAVENLRREGIPEHKIVQVGDVMYDVALHIAEQARKRSRIVERLGLAGRAYAVATIHRAENTDDAGRLRAIIGGIGEFSKGTPVVFPLHPRTRGRLNEAGIAVPCGIAAIEPVGYLDMAALVMGARIVATDSGGLQKEAFFHGVPCITLREQTEWVELVETGWNRVVPPTNAARIAAALRSAVEAPRPQSPVQSPYGDGASAERIVNAMVERH